MVVKLGMMDAAYTGWSLGNGLKNCPKICTFSSHLDDRLRIKANIIDLGSEFRMSSA